MWNNPRKKIMTYDELIGSAGSVGGASSGWDGKITVGICSLCGGAVRTPYCWAGTKIPVQCESCGAHQKPSTGLPIIQMEK